MKLAINIGRKDVRYIRQLLKDNNVNPSLKNVTRVLKELKLGVREELEDLIDDAFIDLSTKLKKM